MSREHDEISNELSAIVTDFNLKFYAWGQRHGCSASFGWLYSADKQPKKLEVLAIDKIIYRKPPPTFATLQDAMAKAEGSKNENHNQRPIPGDPRAGSVGPASGDPGPAPATQQNEEPKGSADEGASCGPCDVRVHPESGGPKDDG